MQLVMVSFNPMPKIRVSSYPYPIASYSTCSYAACLSTPSLPVSIESRTKQKKCRMQRCAGRSRLVERFDHSVLVRSVDVAGSVALAQPEDRFDDRELSSSCVEA